MLVRAAKSAGRVYPTLRPTLRRFASATPQFDIERLVAIRAELVAEHSLHSGQPVTLSQQAATSADYQDASAPWHWLDRELSSNVAGETGAVCIYDGAAFALSLRSSPCRSSTLQFVEEHRAAEQSHLDLFEALLPAHKHTRLLPMWRAAGFALGFMPAMLSDRALFITVQAVETFVEEHYEEQIGPLKQHARCPRLVELLEHCCADEVHHKDDAAARAGGKPPNAIERGWMALVRLGSAVAAELARRV